MWKKYKINEIDPKYLDIEEKRFKGQKVLLHELIDNDKWIIFLFFSEGRKPLLHPLKVINRVIVYIKYPLDYRGNPTDFHYYQAFRKFWGRCIKTFKNDFDYWQFASETAWLGYGDCEDSSILTGAGLENLKLTRICDYFVSLGAVYKDWRLLGYHAWVIVKIDKTWRLAETTLDTPYSNVTEMPAININTNKWKVGDILYEAMVLFNKEELWEWVEGSEVGERLREYLKKTHKEKESKRKYKEMHKSYMKYMKKGMKVK